MEIIINEHQQQLFEREAKNPQLRDKLNKVEDEKVALEDFIEKNGEHMVDITNGKVYLVQYLKALSELVGKQYAMCAPVRKDGTYGAFYVKPLETFERKYENTFYQNKMRPMRIKQNLYQRMGLNR